MYLRMNKRSLELYASSVSDVALWIEDHICEKSRSDHDLGQKCPGNDWPVFLLKRYSRTKITKGEWEWGKAGFTTECR